MTYCNKEDRLQVEWLQQAIPLEEDAEDIQDVEVDWILVDGMDHEKSLHNLLAFHRVLMIRLWTPWRISTFWRKDISQGSFEEQQRTNKADKWGSSMEIIPDSNLPDRHGIHNVWLFDVSLFGVRELQESVILWWTRLLLHFQERVSFGHLWEPKPLNSPTPSFWVLSLLATLFSTSGDLRRGVSPKRRSYGGYHDRGKSLLLPLLKKKSANSSTDQIILTCKDNIFLPSRIDQINWVKLVHPMTSFSRKPRTGETTPNIHHTFIWFYNWWWVAKPWSEQKPERAVLSTWLYACLILTSSKPMTFSTVGVSNIVW